MKTAKAKKKTDELTTYPASWWVADHLNKLRSAVSATEKAVGGFLPNEVYALRKNQQNVPGTDWDLFKDLLKQFSAPYLVNTQVMLHITDMIVYRRIRGSDEMGWRKIQESEDVVARTYSKDKYNGDDWCYGDCYSHDEGLKRSRYQDLIKQYDSHVVSDLLYNAGTVATARSAKYLPKIVSKVKRMIAEKTKCDANCWTLLPPELMAVCGVKDVYQLTPELAVSKTDNSVYVSRYVPRDRVVVGLKSADRTGYIFCPYILMVSDDMHDYNMILGKKLLREGAGNFGVIQLG